MSDETINDVPLDERAPKVAPRVRPRFRKLAIAAFIVLIPIALFALWDYIEARRLGAAVKALRDAKQPLSTPAGSAHSNGHDNAARYYDAAAALVDLHGIFQPNGLLQRLDRGTEKPEALIGEVRAVLERNSEAEALLHRATELEFHGMRPGFEYNYRWSSLTYLSRLAGLRAYERLFARDAEGVARAVFQGLQLLRPLNWNERANMSDLLSMWSTATANQAMRSFPALLELQPSTETVNTLARNISSLDVDDALERSIVLERVLLVQTFWNEPHQWYARPWRQAVSQPLWHLIRPWIAHRAIESIALLNRYQEAARRPWPARLGDQADLSAPPPARPTVLGAFVHQYSTPVLRYQHARRVAGIAQRLALTRAASSLLAIEQYRRTHGGSAPETLADLVPQYLSAVPIDPYSGQPMLYVREGDRVKIYSIGVNRKDDGGEKLGDGPSRRWGAYLEREAPPDIGLAMRLSGGSN